MSKMKKKNDSFRFRKLFWIFYFGIFTNVDKNLREIKFLLHTEPQVRFKKNKKTTNR